MISDHTENSINSFSQLVGKTKRGGVFKTWAPREGEHAML